MDWTGHILECVFFMNMQTITISEKRGKTEVSGVQGLLPNIAVCDQQVDMRLYLKQPQQSPKARNKLVRKYKQFIYNLKHTKIAETFFSR